MLIVPGGKVTMFFAILMFGEAGAEILYPNPGFPIYESVIKLLAARRRCRSRSTEENGFSFDADEVLAKITPRTRLLIINSPPIRPAASCRKAELDKLVAGPRAHPQVAILSDEIYGADPLRRRASTSACSRYPSAARPR